MQVRQAKRLKDVERENVRLKYCCTGDRFNLDNVNYFSHI